MGFAFQPKMIGLVIACGIAGFTPATSAFAQGGPDPRAPIPHNQDRPPNAPGLPPRRSGR